MKRQVARTIAVALLLSVATGGAASAADMAVKASAIMPSAAVYNWTGWYAGVNGGWAFEGNTTGRLVSADPLFNAVLAVGATPTFFGVKHEGGFGGGQVGYNWQMANWLVGVEADIQGADIGRTSTLAFPGTTAGIAPSVSTARDYIAWFGTLRGRVGLPVGPALLYATGGLAYGGVRTTVTNSYAPATGNFAGNDSSTRVGWAAGAGVEWGFAPSWTLRGEYLHLDLGRSNVTMADPAALPGVVAIYGFSHVTDTVRVGVNHRFGPTSVVAKY